MPKKASGQESVRTPVQERSQKRVAQILSAARAIIERQGAAGLKMSTIAAEADVSIGSIYQYFPNKSAIIAALAEQVLGANTRKNMEVLAKRPASLVQLSHITTELLDQYYRLLRNDPVYRDILTGHASDKKLLTADQDDTVANRDHIFAMSNHLFRAEEHERAKMALLMIVSFGGAAAAIAADCCEDEGRRAMEDAKAMLFAAWEVSILPLGHKHGASDK
ncbi:TetR/AcrR family transcriptional regulator [Tateyamaria omphalii]|uniref:TetR/AcrR family transcriptional regulator n=1 Tax=Tateyamaria omphalii TaxID=299262 RepID=UPI001C995873|nr:TetR/AcrR family transcriptional regulator [Tateyamaria omphalii]MBY5934944.1 TetR/AcrR family transcriptional regulator [Tateyamaria omphalii]